MAGLAAQFERPLIVTDVGGLAEMVGAAGLVAPPDDPAALAAALRRFLGDPALQARLGAGARALKASLSWDALCLRLETLMGFAADSSHADP